MLNGVFAFGVPLFLLVIYIAVEIIRKRTTIHYLGSILLLISGFTFAFSLQIWLHAAEELLYTSNEALSYYHGYNMYLLLIPLFLSGVFVAVNIYRGFKRLFLLVKGRQQS